MASILLGLFYLLALQAVYAAGHSIVKRKAEDGKLYVFSSREGCVSVVSNDICPVSWKLGHLFAKQYDQVSKTIPVTLNLLRSNGVSRKCVEVIQSVLCSQRTPKCFEDGASDYGDVKTLCEKIYSSCSPSIAEAYRQQNFCGTLLTGKHPKSKCVFSSSRIKGVCPQPKHKMPEDTLKVYEKASESYMQTFTLLEKFKNSDGTPLYSSECLSKMKEFSCAPLYCSADEDRLLMEHDKDDCNNVVTECFDTLLSSLQSTYASTVKQLRDTLEATCKLYPGRNAQTELAPSTASPNRSSKYRQPGIIVLLLLFVGIIFNQM